MFVLTFIKKNNPMQAIQLRAKGRVFGSNEFVTFNSGKVFTSLPNEEQISEFIEACCDESKVRHLVKDSIKITFQKLQIIQ